MSIRLNGAADQLKATLTSALTIGANGPYIVSGWFRIITNLNDYGMIVALVDQDPDSTISRRLYSDPDTPLDSVQGDTSAGGVGPYQPTTGTWYGFVMMRLASGTATMKIFPDSSSTTQLNSGSNSGDTAALSGLDTVLIGDIEPSARRACDMEFTNLKIQTGVDGWDDTRCRYELDHWDFQSADGTERLAWRLEDTDADTNGLNEIGGAGPNFTNSGAINGSSRPGQLEAAPGGGGSAVPVFFHQLQEQGIA